MLKLYYKIAILCVLFFPLTSCITKIPPLKITGCTYTFGNKDCTNLNNTIINAINTKHSREIVEIQKHANNNFGAVLSLYKGLTDFSFVQVSILDDYPNLIQKSLRGIIPVFYVPLLIIAKDTSSINSFVDLQNKKIGVGIMHSGTTIIANKLLHANNIKYTPIIGRDVDFPYLMQDNSIDAYFCFSISCLKNIKDTVSAGGKVKLIEIPYNIVPKALFNNHYYKYANISLKPYSPYITNKNTSFSTLGSYIGLFTLNTMQSTRVNELVEVIKKSLENDSYSVYTANNAPDFQKDVHSPFFPKENFFFTPLHEGLTNTQKNK